MRRGTEESDAVEILECYSLMLHVSIGDEGVGIKLKVQMPGTLVGSFVSS